MAKAKVKPKGDDFAEDDMAEGGEGDDEGMLPVRPNRPLADLTPDFDYKEWTRAFDEVISAEELCDPDELTRLRAYLDQQMVHLSGAVTKLANRLQRRLMAQQLRSWDFDQEEGMLDAARLARVIVVSPGQFAELQGRARYRVQGHGGDAADRQFGVDARAADFDRGDQRGHHGADAGTLRREDRNPRLHDAPVEGRAEPRELAGGGAAPCPRPAQRFAPHRLQGSGQSVSPRADRARA